MVGGALGVAVFGGIYRAMELSNLRSQAAAAHLTSAQQTQVNDAFSSSDEAKQIYDTLSADVQTQVREAVHVALSHGIGGSLKIAAVFALVAVVVAVVLVPKGVLHKSGAPGAS